MSLIPRFFTSALSKLPLMQSASKFHSVASTVQNKPIVSPGGIFSQVTRSVVRCHFPRPSERRRVQRHGWQKRMSTASGRRVLMNRILKGRWIYSH